MNVLNKEDLHQAQQLISCLYKLEQTIFIHIVNKELTIYRMMYFLISPSTTCVYVLVSVSMFIRMYVCVHTYAISQSTVYLYTYTITTMPLASS